MDKMLPCRVCKDVPRLELFPGSRAMMDGCWKRVWLKRCTVMAGFGAASCLAWLNSQLAACSPVSDR